MKSNEESQQEQEAVTAIDKDDATANEEKAQGKSKEARRKGETNKKKSHPGTFRMLFYVCQYELFKGFVQYSYTLIGVGLKLQVVGLKLQVVGLILLCLGLTDFRLCESQDSLVPDSRWISAHHVSNHKSKIIRVSPTTPLHCNGDMSQWHIIITDTNLSEGEFIQFRTVHH